MAKHWTGNMIYQWCKDHQAPNELLEDLSFALTMFCEKSPKGHDWIDAGYEPGWTGQKCLWCGCEQGRSIDG